MVKIFKKVKPNIFETKSASPWWWPSVNNIILDSVLKYFSLVNSSFLDQWELYEQLLAFLDQFLPNNDKIWNFTFTFLPP